MLGQPLSGSAVSFSAGTDFRSQNLTSMDVSFWRPKSVPELKGLSWLRINVGTALETVVSIEPPKSQCHNIHCEGADSAWPCAELTSIHWSTRSTLTSSHSHIVEGYNDFPWKPKLGSAGFEPETSAWLARQSCALPLRHSPLCTRCTIHRRHNMKWAVPKNTTIVVFNLFYQSTKSLLLKMKYVSNFYKIFQCCKG